LKLHNRNSDKQALPWSLRRATTAEIDELMSWFPNEDSVVIWGGPKFAFPFTSRSFRKNCRLREFSSYCLRSPEGEFAAFGQLASRHKRQHLARLVVCPPMRRRGIAKILITMLLEEARISTDCQECGLYVFRYNEPAYRCYLSLGFAVHEYPPNAPMRGECYYMTRAMSSSSDTDLSRPQV
jgi:ribosomal protein S18 acetylase RimI-like enzyme